MATTTPNFGWPVPTSTDLVKDGATAIEALGDGIDASLLDLKGGTTGQVLAKASNTDLDYSWVTTDDTNAIQNAIVDAKGDLIAASAADTPARLAVGNNGETLLADSSTSTGLRYQGSMAAGKNAIINGGFDVWQRGTSFVAPANNSYTADRWAIASSAVTTTYAQESSVIPTNSRYAMKISQATNNATVYFSQAIETINAVQFAGKTVTFSAQLAASASTAVTLAVYYSTSTDVGPSGTWTNISPSSGGGGTITSTTYSTNSGVYAIPSTAKSILTQFIITLSAGNSLYIAQTQLELGSVATTFTRAGGNIQGELAACQRYYVRFTNGGVYQSIGGNTASSATGISTSVPLPVQMRTTPTSIEVSTLGYTDNVGAVITGTIALVTSQSSPTKAYLAASSLSSAATQFRYYDLLTNNSATGFLGVNAEL